MEHLTQNFSEAWESGQRLIVDFGVNILAALFILIVGLSISRKLSNLITKICTSRKVDATLSRFGSSVVYAVALIVTLLLTIAQLGIETASLVAVLASAGLAVGLALQGSLSNLASGVLLIALRPFRVGDVVEVGATIGTVDQIGLFNTTLRTADNRTVFFPNSKIASDRIVNFSLNPTRRIDLEFGVSYSDDLDKVRRVLMDVLAAESRILPDPQPNISINTLADNSVNLIVRPWVKTEDYWNVYWALIENVKKAFDANGISIPFPQREVHVIQKP